MKNLFVTVTVIAGMIVASAPVADAHTLTFRKAKAATENAMLQFVKSHESDLGFGTFSPPLSSQRVSRHKWVFRYAFRFDGDSTTEGKCKVSVQYRNANSQSTRWRVYAIQVE